MCVRFSLLVFGATHTKERSCTTFNSKRSEYADMSEIKEIIREHVPQQLK